MGDYFLEAEDIVCTMTPTCVHSKPRISVVILTYNRARDLKRCLDSLMRQTFEEFEVVVIDNGSTDETERVLLNYSVSVLKSLTRNKAYLRNLGLRRASGDMVAFIDDDAEAHPIWLENIARTYRDNKSVGAVGGPAIVTGAQVLLQIYSMSSKSRLMTLLLHIYEKVIAGARMSSIGKFTSSGVYTIGGSLPESSSLADTLFVDMLSTCNASVRREAAEAIDGFDENFTFNHEDGDFFIRLRESGYLLAFNPRAIVYHNVNPNPLSRASAYYMGRDFGYFYAKHAKPINLTWRVRLMLNLLLFNLFWIYKASRFHNLSLLRAIAGFIEGFVLLRKTTSHTA